MSKTNRRITLVVVLSMILAVFTPILQEGGVEKVHAVDQGDARRISGSDRYHTAGAIAKEAYPEGSNEVIIVRGDGTASSPNVVDALAASGFAGVIDAPILLVDNRKSSLPEGTLQALTDLGAEKAYIIGGTAAVNQAIEEELDERLHKGFERITEPGKGRYDTAARVARELLNRKPTSTAIIAGGYAEVDSLIAGPLANKEGYPILLVGGDLHNSTREILVDYGIEKVIIIGGEVPVPKKVEEELIALLGKEGVERVAGDALVGENREGTSLQFAERFFAESHRVHLVNGYSFVDAVAASVLRAPILYTRANRMSTPVTESLKDFSDYRVIGGTAVITWNLQGLIHEGIFEEPMVEALIRMEGIAIGDSESRVISSLGQPRRKDASRYGFYWYIYNQDYDNYLQVGILNGKVVGLYTSTGNWSSQDDLAKDMSADELKAIYPDAREIGGGSFSYVEGNTRMVMIFDNLKTNQPVLGAIEVLDNSVYQENIGDKQTYQWQNLPFSKAEVEKAYQRQILDLANTSRAEYGLKSLIPCTKATAAAQGHSQDMRNENFFSHYHPDGTTPWERLADQGIQYTSAAENIAANQQSPIAVHWGWMNSSGHRKNILSNHSYLGVGVAFRIEGTQSQYGSYFTQNFYIPR